MDLILDHNVFLCSPMDDSRRRGLMELDGYYRIYKEHLHKAQATKREIEYLVVEQQNKIMRDCLVEMDSLAAKKAISQQYKLMESFEKITENIEDGE